MPGAFTSPGFAFRATWISSATLPLILRIPSLFRPSAIARWMSQWIAQENYSAIFSALSHPLHRTNS